METQKPAIDELLAYRLALISLADALAEGGRPGCAAAFDFATGVAVEAPRVLLQAAGVDADEMIGVRFNAHRILNQLCGSCGECARGRGITPET